MTTSFRRASKGANQNNMSMNFRRTKNHLPLSIPSKEQRSLLQSSNARPGSRFLKPGILKGAALFLALAIAVFIHLGKESEETSIVEDALSDVKICEDDPEFTLMVNEEHSCATYVAHLGQGPHRGGRCNKPIGIPDEDKFQKLLKHYCRKSCGLCATVDPEAGVSDAIIKAEALEIAEEIGGKEMEKQVKEAMEDQELDEMIEMFGVGGAGGGT